MENEKGLDRRTFLKLLASGTASGVLFKAGVLSAIQTKTATTEIKSQVLQINSKRVISYEGINRRILREMFTDGLTEMTHASSFSSALKELFSKKDIIGFKFNSSDAKLLGTNAVLAEEIFSLVTGEGYEADKLVFIEVQPKISGAGKFKFGWGKEINFGSGKDSFALVLDQVTALVNVGALKTNTVAQMSGCLKNMSYGLIKHPARFHSGNCAPYIADIYSQPEIGDKIRFNLLSALRVLLRQEDGKITEKIVDYNSLIFGRDVVAVDSTGFEILDSLRKKNNFKPLLKEGDFPLQLISAAKKGLGVYHPDQISLKTLNID